MDKDDFLRIGTCSWKYKSWREIIYSNGKEVNYLEEYRKGAKEMRLGPTLPGFLSPGVVKVLVEKFDIKLIGNVQEDISAMMTGN